MDTTMTTSPSTKQPIIPLVKGQWYRASMSGAYAVTMGDRGRLVVPMELRDRAGFSAGAPLVLLEVDGGVLMLTREQAKARVRAGLADHDVVGDLLSERRRAAAIEDEP